jgi:hypothetical protein
MSDCDNWAINRISIGRIKIDVMANTHKHCTAKMSVQTSRDIGKMILERRVLKDGANPLLNDYLPTYSMNFQACVCFQPKTTGCIQFAGSPFGLVDGSQSALRYRCVKIPL